MHVNSWDTNLLKKRLEYYKRLLKEEKDNDQITNILKAINSIEKLIEEMKGNNVATKKPSYQYTLKKDKELKGSYKEFLPIVIESSNYLLNNNIDLTIHNKNTNISKDQILTSTRDFFYDINDIYLERYLDYYENDRIFINFTNYEENASFSGTTNCLDGVNECYINISFYNQLFDICTSIHEHGHAIANSLNSNHKINPYINEVESIFFELLYLDKIDYNDYSKETVLKTKENSVCLYTKPIYYVGAKNITTLQGIANENEAKKMIKKTFALPSSDITYILTKPLDNYINYAISFLIAIELLYIYKRNEYAALKVLRKIIELNSTNETSIYNELTSMGIKPGKNFEKFFKDYLEIKSISKTLH